MATLLDIEGTVCSISFVKDVLYPYFLREYPSVIARVPFPIQRGDSELSTVLSDFPASATASPEALHAHITGLVDSDTKDPVLKAFQGIVWKLGYDSGALKAPLYEDAIAFVKGSSPTYIYSSGSVPAQKLLFAHVDVGGVLEDLTPCLSGYFDITTLGHKNERALYARIAKAIGVAPHDIVFYSDNVHEVRAALAAGMRSTVVVRPGNAPLSDADRAELDTVTRFPAPESK